MRRVVSETLPDRVHLPGTTSQNFVGIESKVADKLGVIEKFTYRGVAWYQRDIDIRRPGLAGILN